MSSASSAFKFEAPANNAYFDRPQEGEPTTTGGGGTISDMTDAVGRPELDAKLDKLRFETRADFSQLEGRLVERMKGIEGKIDTLSEKVGADLSRISEAFTKWTVATVLAVVLAVIGVLNFGKSAVSPTTQSPVTINMAPAGAAPTPPQAAAPVAPLTPPAAQPTKRP